MNDQLLTPAEVAHCCQVSTKTVLRAIAAGRLRASRLGRRGAYRVRAADVDAWLDAATLDVTPGAAMSVPKVSRRLSTSPTGGRLAVGEGMGRHS